MILDGVQAKGKSSQKKPYLVGAEVLLNGITIKQSKS
jgi:hypothetical protein